MVWDVAHTLHKGIASGLLKMEVQGKNVKVNGLSLFMRYCEAYGFVLLVVTVKVVVTRRRLCFRGAWIASLFQVFWSKRLSTTLRDHLKGPEGGPQPLPSKLPRLLENVHGTCPRRGLAPPWAKLLVCVPDVSRTLLSQNLISRNLWEHLRVEDLFPDEICENKTQGQNVRVRHPGTTIRVPEEDLHLGQASCQGILKMCMEGACPRCGLAPPWAKLLVCVADSSVCKFNFQKLVQTSPGCGLVSR
ncbi:hypothetical protein MTR67_039271 [Solanum verrucosum]|uniref:Uncharacterized protein n=1 Tax=Solanum verrucosum TaxID=315347 RepID=A0AAF0ZNP8_SOLVR|nr:hypothetical protein MTR67_039271 [Solanum verrucosum]